MTGHAGEELQRLDASIVGLQRRVRLPDEVATARMLRELGAAEAVPASPPPQILEEVRARLLTGTEWPTDLRSAPWILWHGNPPAIGIPGLLDRIVTQASRRRTTLRNLIEAWLRDFGPLTPGIGSAGLAIRHLLASGGPDRFQLWREAQARYGFFEVHSGPAAIATELMTGDRPVEEILRSAGLYDELRGNGGYMRAVHDECLRQMAVLLLGRNAAGRWERPAAVLTVRGKLRFPDARLPVARALLRPWMSGERQVPFADCRGAVTEFLLSYVGHPQLRPRAWIGLEPEAAILRQWLTQASLRVFFGLIADHALESHWRYREAFWSACLNKGAISDAWLALGQRVNASARARKELGAAFGLLAGTSDQSVLLMRVGPIIVAEWSHNGKLRAWPADHAPELYRAAYRRSDLTQAGLPFPPDPLARSYRDDRAGLVHHNGVWQRRAAALLARHAGVILHSGDWQIR